MPRLPVPGPAEFFAICQSVWRPAPATSPPIRRHRLAQAQPQEAQNHLEYSRQFRLGTVLLRCLCLCLLASVGPLYGQSPENPFERPDAGAAPVEPPAKYGPPTVKIVQFISPSQRFNQYRNALPSLLKHLREVTSINLDPDPIIIESFDDPVIFQHPFIYVNFSDRESWEFSDSEKKALKQYLERGGFMYVDAGINAEFLRGAGGGQHHSFADWQASPELERAFDGIFPNKPFRPLKRSHAMYQSFYKGLPDPAVLPDSVREYVVTEKWPQGTYAAVGLQVNGRLAVLATPIVAMGWGRDQLGNWSTQIGFRVRESATELGDVLETAAYSGPRYETKREDGGTDIIYCQDGANPAWVLEPSGRYRVFNYHHGREISEFAHTFFTQLGSNIIVHALSQ